MVWARRSLKDHLVPTPLTWAEQPKYPTRSASSKPNPTGLDFYQCVTEKKSFSRFGMG